MYKKCEYCGTEFKTWRSKARFCSHPCYQEAKKKQVKNHVIETFDKYKQKHPEKPDSFLFALMSIETGYRVNTIKKYVRVD